jgi:hypothetical protein
VSPKRAVAIMTAVFATLGVGVSVGIIAAGGGFSGQGPSITNPPTKDDIWVVGSHINDGTALEYDVTAVGPASSLADAKVSMDFAEARGEWDVHFMVVNGTEPAVEHSMTISKQLTREGELDKSFQPYFDPIQESIFAVRDMDYGDRDKYLVIGAPWNTIFFESTSVTVRVTSQEPVQTPAGTFDAFVLGYKLGEKESKIWVVKDMPLPVKAEVYDVDDNLQYKYELVRSS